MEVIVIFNVDEPPLETDSWGAEPSFPPETNMFTPFEHKFGSRSQLTVLDSRGAGEPDSRVALGEG